MKYNERLEEIKEKYSEVTVLEYVNDVEVVGVDINDLVWLINRVGELENEKSEWKDTAQSYYVTNQELIEQNKRYRKALEEIRDKESEPYLLNDRQRVYTMTGRIALEALEGEK